MLRMFMYHNVRHNNVQSKLKEVINQQQKNPTKSEASPPPPSGFYYNKLRAEGDVYVGFVWVPNFSLMMMMMMMMVMNSKGLELLNSW